MKFKNKWTASELTVAEAVAISIGSTMYEGAIEKAISKADNIAEKFGELVQMLHENGSLTEDNVLQLVSYEYEAVTQ